MNCNTLNYPSRRIVPRLLAALAAAVLALMAVSASAQTQSNYCNTTNIVKWLLPPQAQGGLDVLDSHRIMLADDFLCTNTGPITDIHVWGSWSNDLVGAISEFYLFIYSDVQASATNQYSEPGTLLWQEAFPAGQFSSNIYTDGQEYFYDPSNSIIAADTVVWQFCFQPTNPFVQTGSLTNQTVYWLAIFAAVGNTSTNYYGWKSSTEHFNDPAVWASCNATGTPIGNWNSMFNNPQDPGQQIDLSFELYTSANTNTNCPISYTCPPPTKTVQCGSSWTFDPPTVGISQCCPAGPPTVTLTGAVTNGACPQIATATWTITDCLGHTAMCSQQVTIEDTTPPTVTCPSNIVESTAATNLQVFWTVSASDPCSGTNVTVTSTPASGSYFTSGTTNTVVVTAIDPCGNSNTCSFTVTVDYCPIPYTCPSPKQVQCGSNWTFDPPVVGNDPCCPNGGVTVFFNGATTNGVCPQIAIASWTISDCMGNRASCSQVVTVVDTTPPAIVCPSNIVGTTCATNLQVFWTVSATDACSGTNVTVTSTPPSGSFFNIGTTPVIVTATDPCGNSNSCSFTVTIEGSGGGQKYVQLPNLNNGFDICNNHYVFADDFVCSHTGPITGIELWGSWLNNQPLLGSITYWLAIYSDVPAVGNGFSHPGNLLWSEVFPPGTYSESFYANGQEQFYDLTSFSPETQVWSYCFTPTNPFIQAGTAQNPQLYWLMSYAQLPAGIQVESGWKTTAVVTNDSCVYTVWPGGYPPANWGAKFEFPTGAPTDLAFALSTETNTVTINCPSNIIATTCTSNLQVFWTVSASSSCPDGTNVTAISSPPSGTYFNADTTNLISVTAFDACANSNTCSFEVIVTRPVLGSIHFTNTSTNLTLTWTNGILQTYTTLIPLTNWIDVPGATSPFTTNFTGSNMYFRLRCESP